MSKLDKLQIAVNEVLDAAKSTQNSGVPVLNDKKGESEPAKPELDAAAQSELENAETEEAEPVAVADDDGAAVAEPANSELDAAKDALEDAEQPGDDTAIADAKKTVDELSKPDQGGRRRSRRRNNKKSAKKSAKRGSRKSAKKGGKKHRKSAKKGGKKRSYRKH